MIRLRKARHAVLQNRTFTRGYWCLEISLLGLCALMSFGVKHKEYCNHTHLVGIWLTRNSGFRRSIFPRKLFGTGKIHVIILYRDLLSNL